MPASKNNLLRLLDRLAPDVRDAFVASVDDIKRSARLQVIEAHLQAGNIEAALESLNVRREFFAPLEQALTDAYRKGGADALRGLPDITDPSTGARVEARFDASNPRAEAFLRATSASMVTSIAEETKDLMREILAEGVVASVPSEQRAFVRDLIARGTVQAFSDQERAQLKAILADSTAARKSIRDVARTIIGYKNKVTGLREGGVLGLDRQKVRWALEAQAQLLSGDQKQMRAYLTRKARDRSHDAKVVKAIKGKARLEVADARLLAARYSQRLLRVRGMMIARTELLGSLHKAQDEGLQQMVERGVLRPDQIKRRWDAANDAATRDTHRALDNDVKALGQPFVSPSGAMLNHPGDTSLGAPAEEIINCRCVLRIDIDFIAGVT